MTDWDRDLILKIYDTVADPTLWPAVLDRISEGVGARGCLMFEIDAARSLTPTHFSSLYEAEIIAGYLATLDKSTPETLATARDALATPNTLSLKMVETLREQGGHDALYAALTAVGAMLDTKES